ncbi:MAG TPA: hydroxymethylbilane synthase [Cytophagaceae bacterium]
MSKEVVKIGTRASKLAMWQAEHVKSLLEKEGMQVQLFPIETKGDKVLSQPFFEIGSKGLFTEELEDKLIKSEIDIAVHSAKDMQTTLVDGLDIIAFTEREQCNDVLVSHDPAFSLTNMDKPVIVGTSSMRRRALLKHYFPHVELREARGNLQTRMQKMTDGQFDAMILAYAGIHRMEYDEKIIQVLPLEMFTPQAGQGSLAIESSVNVSVEKRELIRKITNHPETETCLLAERAFLRELEGGCSIPVFAHATLEGDHVWLSGGVISLDGKKIVRQVMKGSVEDPELIGKELADVVLEQGGREILQEIREVIKK